MINDKTVARINLVLLVAVLMAVARGSWVLAEISTKVDAMWAAYVSDHRATACIDKEASHGP